MRRKRLTATSAVLAAALIQTPAAAQKLHVNPRWEECSFQLDPSLTQAAWHRFAGEAGLVVYFRSLDDARPLAKGKFEVSALQWQTKIDDAAPAWATISEAPVIELETTRYERSGLGETEAAKLEKDLLFLMDRDRPWTDSELTLADLADRLGTTPHKLSEVLNAQIGKTFYDFVNGYRVRDVQRRIQSGEARTRKMLALALDAGFASKSTFNQAFKKHTNQTPSDFGRLHLPAADAIR